MNTLFLTFTYLKGNRGGIYASRTHINLFAEISESMTLLYPYKKGMEPEGINDEKIEMIPIEDSRSKFKKILDLCRGVQSRFFYGVNGYINRHKYDTVVFDSSQTSSRLIDKFKTAGFRIITIHHNYQIDFLRADTKGIAKWLNIFWTYRSEGNAVRQSDLNLTLTQSDILLLRKHYSANANFSVLGVFDYQRKKQKEINNTQRGNRFVITGGLGAKQNEDCLIPWLDRYYPLLKQKIPSATLTLAGRDPSSKLISVAQKHNVKVIPSPKDMAPILADSDFYICTTDRGGGLKLRILDGLKSGLPVLTHTISARGYERMEAAGIVYPYHDEISFVESLDKILRNHMSKKEIQKIYLQQYSFDTGVEVLKGIFQENNFI